MHTNVIVLFAALTASLTGCFAEMDASEVTLSRTCDGSSSCTIAGVPDVVQAIVPLALTNGSMGFAIDLGDQPVVAAEEQLGPTTLESVMTLDELTVSTHDGVKLDGVTQLTITQIAEVDCATDVACHPQMIGSFERGSEPSTDPTKLTLTGSGVNLLTFGTKFVVRIDGSGRLPAAGWMLDLALTAHVQASAH